MVSALAAGFAALDAPVLVIGSDASIVIQNAAAEKAFGSFPVGAHLSSKLRSPGILDMVSETIATRRPNQIEHAERLPSERVYIARIAPVGAASDGASDSVVRAFLPGYFRVASHRPHALGFRRQREP